MIDYRLQQREDNNGMVNITFVPASASSISFSSITSTDYFGNGSSLSGIITGATSVGSGTNILNSISDKSILLNSISSTDNNKVSVTLSSNTVNLDINEPNLSLWPIVVKGNTLISGGASLLSGLTFNVSPLSYIIGATIYNITGSTTVTLDSGSTENRIDVIIADISGNTGVVSGVPSPNPVKPQIDPSTQVEVSFVTVIANSSGTSVTTTLIYNEKLGPPTEWEFSTNNPTTISGDSTGSAYQGTKSIELINASNNDYFNLSAQTPFDTVSQNVLQFAIKMKSAWSLGGRLRFQFYSSTGVPIGNSVDLVDGSFGFNKSNTSTWQVIAFALSNFSLSTTILSQLRVTAINSPASQKLNCYLDFFRFQEGVPTVTPANQWLNIQADDLSTIQASTPSDTLIMSGGSNINTTTDGTKSLVINLDNNINLNSITSSLISATTISATTLYGGGNGLVNIPVSGVTNLQTELNTKISGATNLSAEGIFAQKNGLDLEFKGLTSTGSSLNISSNPNSVNLDVVFPTDVFVYSGNANASNSTLSFLNTTGGTFTVTNSAALFADNDINVTGGTYNPSNGCVTFTTNSGTTFDVCGFLTGITDTYVTGFTYNNANTLTITRNDGTNISTSIDIVTGLTVNGNIEMGNTSTRQIYSTGVSDISSIEYATSGTSIQMRWDGGGNSTVLSINNTDFATLSSNKTAFGGLTYGSDYSPYYTDRSLIDLGFFNSNNRYVTGGTYNNNTSLITYSGANGFTPFSVDLSSLDLNNTFVTGATYNNSNTFTYTNNSGGTFDVSFNVVSGLTATGSISATTYYGDGSNLTGIVASWDGLEIITVGEDVTDGDLLYLSSGSTYLKASNTSEGTSSTELRIAVENILSGQTGNGLIQGKYTTSGLTAGDQYWVGASNGSYTNIQPSGDGDIVRYVGTALNSTILEFKPDETWIEISSASTPIAPTQPAIKNVTTSYNLLSTDYTINVTTTGDTTQTLPLSVSLTGKIYNIKNSDSTGTSTITIATTSGELIDNLYGGGNDLQTIFPQSIKLQSTGSGWIII